MNENISPQGIKYLVREAKKLTCENSKMDGIKVAFGSDDLTDLQVVIDGPEGTPFEGGSFKARFVFGSDFPNSPPKGFFTTKIFHPNIAPSGEICVNLLKRDWKPTLGLSQVLMTIRCLLIEPNAESALNEEAARLLLDDYTEFRNRAKLMTSIHATSSASTSTQHSSSDAASSSGNGSSSANKRVSPTEKKKQDKKKKNLRRL